MVELEIFLVIIAACTVLSLAWYLLLWVVNSIGGLD